MLVGELTAAKISVDEGGQPYSAEYGDIYASRDGAVAQAEHVFLSGNGLPARWQNKPQFVILENGFGLGTNFLTTLKAWRRDASRPERLFFVSIERHPVQAEDLVAYASPEVRNEACLLAERWPQATPGVHELNFEDGRVRLLLYFMSAETASKRLALGFDALYLDGFSPKKNPEMWGRVLLKRFAQLARPGATLATWCVAGFVREALFEAGFEVEKRPGFGHKAFMTVGHYAPRFKLRRMALPPQARASGSPKKALIIGAGLAGCALSRELAERGWELNVIDAGPIAASQASAIRYGMLHAQVAGDDNILYRLTRSGVFFAEKALEGKSNFYRGEGLFQMARDEAELRKWKEHFTSGHPFPVPRGYLELLSAEEATARIGACVARGGLWHKCGGLVNAGPWARFQLQSSGARVLTNRKVDRLVRKNALWLALDENGTVLAEAPFAIIAAASDSARLLNLPHSVKNWRGRISLLSEEDLPFLNGGITGKGYAIRSEDGWVCAGASYEEDGEECPDAAQVHIANLQKLRGFFPNLQKARAEGFFDGMRAVSRDRLPIVGPIALPAGAESEGLYCAFGFASRAITLCDLSARIIAAHIEGEPLPIESDLGRAISPLRLLTGP